MNIGGTIVAIIVCVGGIILYQYKTSKHFVWEAEIGNITLLYDDNTINGYFTSGISYDLVLQQSYAEQIGVEEYLKDFETFFQTNMNGSCHKKWLRIKYSYIRGVVQTPWSSKHK